MATAAGKITTAKLTDGTEILVTRLDDGTLDYATTKGGSIIATVSRTVPIGRGLREIHTDQGILKAFGHNTHFLATENDVKRVKREAAKSADQARAAEESATVLDGVTLGPITLTESGVAKLAAHTGATPERIRGAARRQGFVTQESATDDGVTTGTVQVRRERIQARRDVNGVITRRASRNGVKWVIVGATVAATFAPDRSPVPTDAQVKETIRRNMPTTAANADPAPVIAMAAVKRAYRDPAVAAKNFRALADACRKDADKAKAAGHKSWWAKSQAATYWDQLAAVAESGAA